MEKSKKLQIQYEGTLKLADFEIPCYVLDDGTRILSGRGMQNALKLGDENKQGIEQAGNLLAQLLANKRLNPFIINENTLEKFKPITCYQKERKISGYEATILVDICDAILEARKQGVAFTKRQDVIANQCEILVRAFAKVGIIALVDEATGYQYDRERYELQKILKAYISEELLVWEKRFPDEFYREIFRLNKWDFTVKGIQQRPGVVGTWTNRLIYEQLPKGVLQELRKKTPKNEKGKFKAKLHQSLTIDIGHPHLDKQLVSVIILMNVSSNWQQFLKLFNKKFGQQDIFENYELIEPKDKTKYTDFDKQLKGVLSVPPQKNDIDEN